MKQDLNKLVNKTIVNVTRLKADEIIQVEFNDGTLWRVRATMWGELAEDLCDYAELVWEFDEIQDRLTELED